jgi:regulatory protein
MNKAVHYLGRYSASQQRLREVLGRFAKRKLVETPPEDIANAMNNVVATCVRLGYVDDVQFAALQARSQRRQGKSSLRIKQKLRVHALDSDAITTAIETADGGVSDGELAAAIQFARRRRLGPFFRGDVDDKTAHRHMGSLARAGYSMGICRTIINADDTDQLEKLEQDALAERPDGSLS